MQLMEKESLREMTPLSWLSDLTMDFDVCMLWMTRKRGSGQELGGREPDPQRIFHVTALFICESDVVGGGKSVVEKSPVSTPEVDVAGERWCELHVI